MSWAAFVLVALAFAVRTPLIMAVPLAVLAAGFEISLTLHLGVERIGRYLEVFHEPEPGSTPDAVPAWESTIGRIRTRLATSGLDPLAARLFTLAVLLNLGAALFASSEVVRATGGSVLVGLAGTVLLHAAAVARLTQAGRIVARQPEVDLEAFRQPRSDPGRPT